MRVKTSICHVAFFVFAMVVVFVLSGCGSGAEKTSRLAGETASTAKPTVNEGGNDMQSASQTYMVTNVPKTSPTPTPEMLPSATKTATEEKPTNTPSATASPTLPPSATTTKTNTPQPTSTCTPTISPTLSPTSTEQSISKLQVIHLARDLTDQEEQAAVEVEAELASFLVEHEEFPKNGWKRAISQEGKISYWVEILTQDGQYFYLVWDPQNKQINQFGDGSGGIMYLPPWDGVLHTVNGQAYKLPGAVISAPVDTKPETAVNPPMLNSVDWGPISTEIVDANHPGRIGGYTPKAMKPEVDYHTALVCGRILEASLDADGNVHLTIDGGNERSGKYIYPVGKFTIIAPNGRFKISIVPEIPSEGGWRPQIVYAQPPYTMGLSEGFLSQLPGRLVKVEINFEGGVGATMAAIEKLVEANKNGESIEIHYEYNPPSLILFGASNPQISK
jgi:hypothetical protein